MRTAGGMRNKKKKNITKVEIKEMRGKRVDDGGKENRLQREKK